MRIRIPFLAALALLAAALPAWGDLSARACSADKDKECQPDPSRPADFGWFPHTDLIARVAKDSGWTTRICRMRLPEARNTDTTTEPEWPCHRFHGERGSNARDYPVFLRNEDDFRTSLEQASRGANGAKSCVEGTRRITPATPTSYSDCDVATEGSCDPPYNDPCDGYVPDPPTGTPSPETPAPEQCATASWSAYGEWDACDSAGFARRTRQCLKSPAGCAGGADCTGVATDVRACPDEDPPPDDPETEEPPPAPACGAAAGYQPSVNPPQSSLCAEGTASTPAQSADGGKWTWTCSSNGGTASCEMDRAQPPLCGTAHGQTLNSAPTAAAELCARGAVETGNEPTLSGDQWTWTCSRHGREKDCIATQEGIIGGGAPRCGTSRNTCAKGTKVPHPWRQDPRYHWGCKSGSQTEPCCFDTGASCPAAPTASGQCPTGQRMQPGSLSTAGRTHTWVCLSPCGQSSDACSWTEPEECVERTITPSPPPAVEGGWSKWLPETSACGTGTFTQTRGRDCAPGSEGSGGCDWDCNGVSLGETREQPREACGDLLVRGACGNDEDVRRNRARPCASGTFLNYRKNYANTAGSLGIWHGWVCEGGIGQGADCGIYAPESWTPLEENSN